MPTLSSESVLARPKSESEASSSNPLPPTSAARECLSTPELRQNILRHLDKHTLTVFMRVERKCMFDVATHLYHTVDYIKARKHMAMTTPRQRTYCAAVRVIDARGAKLRLAPADLKKTGFVCKNPKKRTKETNDFLSTYHAEVFDLVVPPMKRKCENLKTVLFGDDGSDSRIVRDTWNVHIDPPSSAISTKSNSVNSGHIDFVTRLYFELNEVPPVALKSFPPPSSNYPMRMRYNLDLEAFAVGDDLKVDEWLAAIRQSPWTADLYKNVDLAGMRVTLSDITSLYRRQIAAGHSQRLEEIYAQSALAWNTLEFNDLAIHAGSSLHTLSLTRGEFIDNIPPESGLDFRDLPVLSTIIRNNLPNLRRFSFMISGIETAEADCKEMLDRDCLEVGGLVEQLDIQLVNGRCPNNVFNILRVLSRFCSLNGRIYIDLKNSGEGRIHDRHNRFLSALRKQSAERRKHLAVVDFVALGMESLQDLAELQYHDDGRVRGLWESRAYKWYNEVKELDSKSFYNADQRTALKEFYTGCRRFMALPQVGSRQTMEREIKELVRIGNSIAVNGTSRDYELASIMKCIEQIAIIYL